MLLELSWEEDAIGGIHNWAVLTLEMLDKTCNGVTSPTTVTFFAAKSMLNDVTPVHNSYINITS